MINWFCRILEPNGIIPTIPITPPYPPVIPPTIPSMYDGDLNVPYFNQINFVKNYYENLNQNFPVNNVGNYGYVAISLLLQYYDVYWNNNFIPNSYNNDDKCQIDSLEDALFESPGVDDIYLPLWTDEHPEVQESDPNYEEKYNAAMRQYILDMMAGDSFVGYPSFPKEELEKSVVESVKNLMSDELIITIVDRAITKINKENSSIDQIKQLKNELKEIKIKIDKFTDLLIEDRNIKLIMDKIDSLKLEEERISKLIYDLQSSDVSISREDVIKKLQQIRDYDYMQPNNIQLFIDSFVEAIYVDKNKKIVVVLSLDNNYYSTEHSWCSDKSLMVELTRIELATF